MASRAAAMTGLAASPQSRPKQRQLWHESMILDGRRSCWDEKGRSDFGASDVGSLCESRQRVAAALICLDIAGAVTIAIDRGDARSGSLGWNRADEPS